jgi:ABC-type amino acid transport substrate-binding protein
MDEGGRMKKRTLSVFCALVLAITLVMVAVLAGCGTSNSNNEKKIVVVVIKEGKLTMGSDTTYPPFETIGDDGKPVGFDVDLATEIASRLGVELDVISVKWEGIIPGLKTGDYDMVMSAMTITPERQAEIDFSDPYIDSNQSIAVQKGNTSINGEADLAGKVVGVQVDTTGQFTAEEIPGIKEIRKYDTILLAFEDLELGRIDAVMNDYPVNAYLSRTRGKSDVVATIKTDEQYGIGIKKGNDQLLQAVNQALADMKADGTYDVIYNKWFGGV